MKTTTKLKRRVVIIEEFEETTEEMSAPEPDKIIVNDYGDYLTPRERDVLELLARGHTNREIGNELGISIRTVESHRMTLRDKLGDDVSRADLVRFALQNGLVTTVDG